MSKNQIKIATTVMLGIAGTLCLVWFVYLLQAALAYSALGTMEGDGTFFSDIFAFIFGTVFGQTAIGAWIWTIIFAVAGGLLLFATYKAYKSKWGKKRGALVFACFALTIIAAVSMGLLFIGMI